MDGHTNTHCRCGGSGGRHLRRALGLADDAALAGLTAYEAEERVRRQIALELLLVRRGAREVGRQLAILRDESVNPDLVPEACGGRR